MILIHFIEQISHLQIYLLPEYHSSTRLNSLTKFAGLKLTPTMIINYFLVVRHNRWKFINQKFTAYYKIAKKLGRGIYFLFYGISTMGVVVVYVILKIVVG